MNVLIVDDHKVVREGVAAMLALGFGATTCVHQASNLDDAVQLASAHPDIEIILLDLFIPGDGGPSAGFAGIEALGRAAPHIPVVILSSSEEPRDVRRALAGGALGYVPKSAGAETLNAALELVLKGEIYIPPLIIEAERATRPRSPGANSQLTERQLEVLAMVVRGSSNKEIARTMAISDKTVKAHVTAIFKALGVTNRTQAASMVRLLGLW